MVGVKESSLSDIPLFYGKVILTWKR